MKRVLIACGVVALAWMVGGVALHAQGNGAATGTATAAMKAAPSLPPNEPGAQGNGQVSKDRLAQSPRHGEWVEVKLANSEKPLKLWVVYPERPDKAPVALVIMEIYGMSDWVRATTDQLAADGFIAIAPDFLSVKPAGTAVNSVPTAEVVAALNAARDYGVALPSANGKSATIGFCWGGTQSFVYAIAQEKLNAAVVFYGQPPQAAGKPDEAQLTKIKCPVAGFFGGADQRVTAVVAPTQEAMKKLEKTFEAHVYEGAGHGFMRQQSGPTGANAVAGANAKAANDAWPAAIKFLTEHTK